MPAMVHLSRGIVLALSVALATGALAACTPPLPPDVLAAKAEAQITCQSGSQEVSVPEDFAGAMTAVSGSLAGPCPEQSITEVTADQPAGVVIVDHAPSAQEVASFASTCATAPIVVPVFAYAVTPTFNIVGLEGLVLTPSAIAGILTGKVTSWEDPVITEANVDYDLSGLPPIAVMSLQEPSGAMEAMTGWLAMAAPQDWTQGAVGTISTGQQYPTVADLMIEVTSQEGSFAIVPALDALNNALPMASLSVMDRIISSDDAQLLKVGSGATKITTDDQGNVFASPAIGGVPVEGNFDAAAAKIVLAEGQPMVGWPVLGYAHAMVCDDPASPLALSTVQYVQRLAGQGSLETFGVTPLPEPIRVRTFAPLKVTVSLDSASPATASPSPSS